MANKARPEDEVILSQKDLIPSTNYVCESCGSTVYIYLANSELLEARPEAAEWDRWLACSNKNCVNHHGAGHFQDMPSWVHYDGRIS